MSPPSSSQTPTPSVRFKSILDDALNRYKQKTGKDLPAIWLDTGLTSCESVDAVLGILQGQAKALEQTSPGNQKLINRIWLSVDVLSTVSATLGEGFSLVLIREPVRYESKFILTLLCRRSHPRRRSLLELVSSSLSVSFPVPVCQPF